MASLSKCVVKAGKAVSPSDAAALIDAYESAKKDGYSDTDAGLKALGEAVADATTELEAIAGAIEKAGVDVGLSVQRGAEIEVKHPDPTGARRERVIKSAKRAWGKRLIDSLVDKGVLNFVTADEVAGMGIDGLKSAKDVKSNQVSGLVVGGKAYIVVDVVADKEIAGVVLHEVGVHYGLPKMLGESEFKALMYDMAQMKESDPDVKAAYDRVPSDTPKKHVNEEAVAYLAQANPNHSIVQRMVEGIKKFLRRMGVPVNVLSDNASLIRDMAIAAMRQAAGADAKVPTTITARAGALFHRAWHGTPHTWEGDKADMSKVGTGEGAQAYGHGLYFAGKRAVAEFYRNNLSRDPRDDLNTAIAGMVKRNAVSLEDAYSAMLDVPEMDKLPLADYQNAAFAVRDVAEGTSSDGTVSEKALRAIRTLDRLMPAKPKGRLYEVELAPTEDQYLDWDKPLSEQSEKVKAALGKAIPEYFVEGWMDTATGMPAPDAKKYGLSDAELNKRGFSTGLPADKVTGNDLYLRMADEGAAGRTTAAQKKASDALKAAGIPGIRYLDGSSRAAFGAGAVTYDVKRLPAAGPNNPEKWIAEKRGKSSGPQHTYFNTKKEADDWVREQTEGQHNYVIFDDKLVEVRAKYSKPDQSKTPSTPRKELRQNEREWTASLPKKDAPKFSKAPQTDSLPFRLWFGKSKVVDKAGKPLVVYHGTASDFWTFEQGKNDATGHATSPLGFYFTPKKAQAQRYAENASEGVPADERVIDVYLAIRNPYEMTVAEAQAIESQDDARKVRAKLEAAGHDGIYITGADSWVAFKPSTIKSASENTGAFDPNNDDIRYSKGKKAQPFPKESRTEKVKRYIDRAGMIVRAPYESAVDKLRRNNITKALGDNIADYFEATRRRDGQLSAIMRAPTRAASEDDLRAFEGVMAAIQNGRGADARDRLAAASKAVHDLINAWQKVAKMTADQNTVAGVQVYDKKIGGWRPIGRIAGFWPRAIKDKYRRAMNDPTNHPAEWAEMVNILLAEGVIDDVSEASQFLNSQFNDETSDDYFAGIEKARGVALPEKLYDYGWAAALTYADAWNERISQIEHFGQSGREQDVFQKVQAGTLDKSVQEHVQRIADVIYKVRSRNPVARGAQWANTLVTGLQLGNPASAIINLVGGITLTAQSFPAKATMRAAADLYKLRAAISEAFDKGILVDDYFGVAADATKEGVPEKLSNFTTGMLKYGGFTSAEHLARAFNMMAAKHFLRDSITAWNDNIGSRKSKLAVAWMQRNGIDYRDLLRENGTGPVTDKYLRMAVNQSQGSYRIDQTPTFIDEPLGRFFLKYQKFSTQVFRMFMRNHVTPFMDSIKGGEKVSIEKNGKLVEERVRNFMPMLRYFLAAAPAGWLAMSLRAMLFGYAEQGPDDDEIKKAFADNETARALGLLMEKGMASIMAIGAFGFVGNYAQALMSWQDRQRFKNPLNPPALAPFDFIGNTLMKAFDQGKLTAADVNDAFESQWSLYRTGKRLVGTAAIAIAPNSSFGAAEQARRDRAWVRKMARRYADETGIEAKRRAPEVLGATQNTPMNRAIKDALLVGDHERAREEALRGLAEKRSLHELSNMMDSIRGAVRTFRPALVMESQSAFEARRFMQWAEKNLTDEGFARLKRVDGTYMEAAKASGLWNWREASEKGDQKDEKLRAPMTADEVRSYIDAKLVDPRKKE